MNVVLCRWDEQLVRLLVAECTVHLVLSDADRPTKEDSDLLEALASVYRIEDFDRIDQLAAVAVDLQLREIPVDRVVSFMETSQYGAALLGDVLGLTRDGVQRVMAVRDKREMKRWLRRAGVVSADFVSVGRADSLPAVADVVARLGLPCVLKPVSGMGCVSTQVITTTSALEGALVSWAQDGTGQIMIEEYRPGYEVHVDAVWRDGHPWVFAVSQYLVPVIDVTTAGRDNGSYVVHERDDPGLYETLRAAHRTVNHALGIRSGITHAEFLVRDGSVTFSELGTRFGGAAVPESVGRSLGVDLRELFVDELLGKEAPRSLARQTDRTVGWIGLAPARAGRLDGITATVAALRRLPYVSHARAVKPEGSFMNPALNPSDVVAVLAVLEADSPDEFRRQAARLEEEWTIEVVI